MDSQETFVALPSQDDSSTTKAELQQRAQGYEDEHEDAPAAKRVKVDSKPENHGGGGRTKGSAPIKAEYVRNFNVLNALVCLSHRSNFSFPAQI